ncbi:phosphotransferase [Microvirga lenta]|uniref:phosphotransferase n=1 Tax=Microvirga lenta TaxID=2881337 RepID=UPI001CFC4917|nr:phosphotransferase [Microvirga lenta]MCB5173665.1 phosphotransferase [Microvirga lenta]
MDERNDAEEQPLSGGGRTAVARRGNVIVRETGPWASSVHALLRHLQQVGFAGAPQVVGSGFDEQGRELLTYIEGEVRNPAPWSDDAIFELGAMMRRLHDATASFRVPDNATWRAWFGRSVGIPDIIGHCDTAPWNIVSLDGKPIGLIDWEVAGPVDRLTELAMATWNNAQLYDDDVAEMNGLPSAASRARQVRIFAEGYELSADMRHRLTYRIIEFAAQSASNEVIEQQITPETEHAPRVWGIAWQTRSVGWLIRNRELLEDALR